MSAVPCRGWRSTRPDDGEILIRGGLITGGYYKDRQGTAEAFGDDGWLHTGDLGRLDDDGFLTIIGRKKEIIITAGGKNVAPARLENLINKHALVSQACLVGDGRRYLTLLVALDPDMAPGWAESKGVEYGTFEGFSRAPQVLEEIRRIVDSANGEVARVEQARKWFVAPRCLVSRDRGVDPVAQDEAPGGVAAVLGRDRGTVRGLITSRSAPGIACRWSGRRRRLDWLLHSIRERDMPPPVVVTRKPPGAIVEMLREVADVWMWPENRAIPRIELLGRVGDAEGLYCMLTDGIDAALLEASPRLSAISQMAVGVDNVDLATCTARGIPVGHTPDVLTETTADTAFGLLIAAARRFREGMEDVVEGRWGEWDPVALVGRDLHGSHARHRGAGQDRPGGRPPRRRFPDAGAVQQAVP